MKIIITLFIAFLSVVTSYIIFDSIDTPITPYNLASFSLFIVITSSFSISFWLLLCPLLLLHILYIPIGINFGMINPEMILAAVTSNAGEAQEFIGLIELKDFLISVSVIILIIMIRIIIQRYKILAYKNLYLFIIALIIIILFPSPFYFPKELFYSAYSINNEYNHMKNLVKDNHWGEVIVEKPYYSTYVLIIGESARRDYHHAYGYPVNNTPFMSSSNGILVNGLQSGGATSVPSLTAMLTLPDYTTWKANYALNLISLLKAANLKTYWLSNSGHIGENDTPISALAKLNDYVFYLKHGNYNSKNTSDFELLDEFNQIINSNEKSTKFIVLHLIGSHYNACDRTTDIKPLLVIKNKNFDYMNCYVNSIYKTDTFLSTIHQKLQNQYQKNNESFSMIYFSDHGLVHRQFSDTLGFANYPDKSKYHFDVPLFKISSDDRKRIECTSFKSGLNFLTGIANWVGIKNDNLEQDYNLFDCKSDPDDYGLSKIIEYSIDDPAINLLDFQ